MPGINQIQSIYCFKNLSIFIVLFSMLAFTVYVWVIKPSRVLKVDQFGKVAVGMSRQEVEQLLGGPSGNYGRLGTERAITSDENPYKGLPQSVVIDAWWDDRNRLEVGFEKSTGKVAVVHTRAGYYQQPARWEWWEKVMDWCGRPFGS